MLRIPGLKRSSQRRDRFASNVYPLIELLLDPFFESSLSFLGVDAASGCEGIRRQGGIVLVHHHGYSIDEKDVIFVI